MFAGRMAGTRGNELATEWLIDRLHELGVVPYNEDGYRASYTGWSNTFTQSEMLIVSFDGSVRRLVQGLDFFISLGEGSFSVTLERDSIQYRFLAIDEERVRVQDASANCFVYFENVESFRNTAGSQSLDGMFKDKTVQLSNDICEIIKSGSFERIVIDNVVSYKETELFHVVGKIVGMNSSNCVVLSAHFDHVGEGGATFFPGALDNASGTASLLYTAERLMSVSETHPFNFDIVIALFNSEEHLDIGPLGSRYFIPVIKDDYENVWNINIDCIGSSEDEIYLTGGSGSSELREAFTSFAKGHGVIVDNSRIGMSDNVNFTALGIPSLNLMSAELLTTGIAHTNIDTPDRLNYQTIVRLSDMIVEFLSLHNTEVYVRDESLLTHILPPTVEGVNEMAQQFKSVFDSLRSGEVVSFYGDFYEDYPDTEQLYFSYSEALQVDERLSYIRDFSSFRLEIIENRKDIGISALFYFHTQNPLEFDLRITPLTPDEFELMYTADYIELSVIPDLPGHTTVFRTDVRIFIGFLYSDGDSHFFVTTARLMTPHLIDMVSIRAYFPEELSISEEDTYVEIVRSLHFNEFVRTWMFFQRV